MTTTQKIEELSSIKTGSEMVYKTMSDAANFSCCAGNKLLFNLTATTTTPTFTFPALIPLRPPCCYTVIIKWTAISTGGSTLSFLYSCIITQAVSGGGISRTLTAVPGYQSNPGVGSNADLAKNVSTDAADLNLTIALIGTVTHSVEVEVISASNF